MKIYFVLLWAVLPVFAGCAYSPKVPADADKVILIHGFARSTVAMWTFADRLEQAGFAVYRVGYASLGRSMEEIQEQTFSQIEAIRSGSSGKLHFVGHSLGGLLIRAYLGEHHLENPGNVVILGSPGRGTPVVDRYRESWWFSFVGPAAESLGTQGSTFLAELKEPHYTLGVIAGYRELPFNEDLLPGPDDGLVQVASTTVKGMKDFIVINTGHTMLRYDREAIRQTIHFLKKGQFIRRGAIPLTGKPSLSSEENSWKLFGRKSTSH